jgi:excinuclease ABC A subunit
VRTGVADRLIVRGAREHNLKNVSLDLPRDSLIVFTGLSGSGKSSLAFDTIFAEGQRRYVESLSSYARQFLGQMDKPDVDFIEGLSPAVSIDQKSTSRNPRSTVGTITEVYDYLRLLFARIGKPHCPECGRPISRQSPQAIVDKVLELPEGSRFQVLSPLVRERKGEFVDLFADLQTKGYSRARVDGETIQLTEPPTLKKQEKHTIEVVIDRLTVKEGAKRRLTDSVETALGLSGGMVVLDFVDLPEDDPERERMYSEHLYCPYDDLSFEELEPRSFSFNSPFGACPDCTGIGTRMEVDPELIVPDEDKSLDEGAIHPWSHGHTKDYFGRLIGALADALGFRTDIPFAGLPQRAKKALMLYGTRRRSRSATATGTAARARLHHALRRRRPLREAAAQRGRERREPRALRGLHARGALPHLSGHAPQAGRPRGHGHGEVDRRGLRDVHQRLRGLPGRAEARRPRQEDRRARAEGGQRTAAVPGRRRPRLPLAQPRGRHPLRRRGPAHPPGDTRSARASSASCTCSTSRPSACTSATTTG